MQTIERKDLTVPIKMWLDDIEPSAMEQVYNLARLPYAFHHIAIMPDAHTGFGMPIGGVLATRNVIIPNAVGVDIGCGMNAVATDISLSQITFEKIKDVIDLVQKQIPVGHFEHSSKQDESLLPKISGDMPTVEQEMDKSLMQLGTLGGGNHFVEIQKGDDGYMWIMLHSGSRHLGKTIGEKYNNMAKQINKQMGFPIPPYYDLAPLQSNSDDGYMYIKEMNYAMEYAFASRKLMMARLKESVEKVFKDVHFGDMINISHNFASLETHFGERVWVHRKGAVQSFKGQYGIIPSSQATESYITVGKGNPESFMSSSHGAGRVMGRREAQRVLNLEEEQAKMKGIVNTMTTQKSLDEAPSAYKDMNTVMKNQKDLVKIVVKLKPLGNLKG